MITTQLTKMFDLAAPIVLAPMGGVSGGRLAAAISEAGGLGMVGGGYGDAAWLREELAHVRAGTARPWGVGFITWSTHPGILELALAQEPHAVMLSFGDPRPFGRVVRAAGCKLICQVQDLASARLAVEAGADLVVAQGSEGGGHGGTRATLPLVPAVIEVVAPIPVIAAGGIADGRGLAAALMLGAQGALLGTRFYASDEALGHAAAKAAIVAGSGDETMRTTIFDAVRGLAWPAPYTGRALRNDFMARWHGHEKDLAAALPAERDRYRAAASAGDIDTAVIWAGEAIDLIDGLGPAGDTLRRIANDAEARLRGISRLLT